MVYRNIDLNRIRISSRQTEDSTIIDLKKQRTTLSEGWIINITAAIRMIRNCSSIMILKIISINWDLQEVVLMGTHRDMPGLVHMCPLMNNLAINSSSQVVLNFHFLVTKLQEAIETNLKMMTMGMGMMGMITHQLIM